MYLHRVPVAVRVGCAVLLSVVAAACGSSSINVNAPTTTKCQVTAASSMSSAPAGGGTGTVSVNTTRDCTWSASSSTPWITITSGTTGQGSGTVGFRIASNGDHSTRQGTLAVNDTALTINQDPAPCTYAVTPANSSVDSPGGALSFNIATLNGCSWTAASHAAWIGVGGSGSGSGRLTVNVGANSSDARSGTFTVADQTVTIAQAGAPAPPAPPAPAPTPPAPTPTPPAPAPTPPPPAPAPTPAPPPPAPPPPAACSYAISPSKYDAPTKGGSTAIAVTTTSSCAWTASSGATWISVESGGSGAGNGRVSLSVAENTGAARTATVTVAGQPFVVSQAGAPCSYAISPTSQSIGSDGGTGTISVTTTSACSWTAKANDDWISITSGASGSGDGSVTFKVDKTKKARSGTIAVAGKTFTVKQAGD